MPDVDLIIFAFLTVLIVASIVSHRTRLPYTQVLVFLGVGLAASSISSLIGVDFVYQNLIGGGLFIGLVLPPLLFESMMNIKSGELKAVIRPAVILATVGVIIATLVGGWLLWTFASMPFYSAFLFSALIAPTDVATVLEIFRRVRVPRRLAAMMETEAAFNDATGIMVFSAVLTSFGVSHLSLVSAVSNFTYIFGMGVLVGLGLGFVSEILTGLVTDPLTETVITITLVFGSYALASAVGASGLVAVAVAGLYYGNFTFLSTTTPMTRHSVKTFWSTIAFIANSVAFLFIGLSTNLFTVAGSLLPIGIAYLSVTIARLASVYPVLSIFHRLGEKMPMSWRNVASLGGMRGALSIALVASLPALVPVRETIATMVLGVAFISITLQAPVLFRYAKRRFPEEQKKEHVELTTRLSKIIASIDALTKLKNEGKISGHVFASELEEEERRLAELLMQIQSSDATTEVMKARISELYSSLVKLPKSSATRILRMGRAEKAAEAIVSESATEEKTEGEDSND